MRQLRSSLLVGAYRPRIHPDLQHLRGEALASRGEAERAGVMTPSLWLRVNESSFVYHTRIGRLYAALGFDDRYVSCSLGHNPHVSPHRRERAMKRILGAVLVAALLSAPQSAQSQVLGTYCGSAATWCFNATAFSFLETVSGTYNASLTGVWSGSAFTGLTGLQWFNNVLPPTATGASSGTPLFTPGVATTNNSSFNAASGITAVSFADIRLTWFDNSNNFIRCGAGANANPCAFTAISVPEPGTGLLMLTGLLGLGFVAWRRKEETLA